MKFSADGSNGPGAYRAEAPEPLPKTNRCRILKDVTLGGAAQTMPGSCELLQRRDAHDPSAPILSYNFA